MCRDASVYFFKGTQRGLVASVMREGSKNFFRIGLFHPILEFLHDHHASSPPIWKRLLAGSISGTKFQIVGVYLGQNQFLVSVATASTLVHTCTHTQTHVCMYDTYVCIYVYTQTHSHTLTHTHTCIYACTYVYIYIHIYIYIYIYVYIHIYMYTYI